MRARFGARPAVAALSLTLSSWALAADAPAAAKEPGDLWEVTSQMSMPGMQMALPASTHKVCTAKVWSEPPGGNADKRCETLEFKNSGSSTTWKVRCPGPPVMTGEGQITRQSPDAYTGTMTVSTEGGVMAMNLSGRRVGDCDRGAAQAEVSQARDKYAAQAAVAQRQAAAGQAAMCKAAVDSMDLRTMKVYETICTDPPLKESFCTHLGTPEAFQLLCDRGGDRGTGLAEAASYCGKDADSLKAKACGDALAKDSFELLAKCCPAQTKELALRECAGRKYTAMAGSKYQSFCVRYAGQALAGGR
jgi:hypothetical protein